MAKRWWKVLIREYDLFVHDKYDHPTMFMCHDSFYDRNKGKHVLRSLYFNQIVH